MWLLRRLVAGATIWLTDTDEWSSLFLSWISPSRFVMVRSPFVNYQRVVPAVCRRSGHTTQRPFHCPMATHQLRTSGVSLKRFFFLSRCWISQKKTRKNSCRQSHNFFPDPCLFNFRFWFEKSIPKRDPRFALHMMKKVAQNRTPQTTKSYILE